MIVSEIEANRKFTDLSAPRNRSNENVARTMSSKEIADLVGSRHDSVKRAIERLADRGVIVQPPSVDEQSPDSIGRLRMESVYQIGKRDSYVIVAQLCPEFTAKLVDRWQELESKQEIALPDFSNPAAAARAWAEQFELRQAANEALAIAAPKVEFVDKYVESTGLKGFRQVAKLLGAKENLFRSFLRDQRIMYQIGGEWVPYANHIDAERFEVKTGSSGEGHVFNQAKFTPKGVTWIAGLWAQHNLKVTA